MPESPIIEASEALADLVLESADGNGYVPLETLVQAARECRQANGRGAEYVHPATAIEEKIDRSAWVLRRLVAVCGFQAELVVYGGDFEEVGTTVQRDCRISLRRDIFEMRHIRALVEFAADNGCELEMNKHGASLRVGMGNHLEITQSDGVEVNALTSGAALSHAGAAEAEPPRTGATQSGPFNR